MLTRGGRRADAQDDVIAAVDVGTHKICCVVASIDPRARSMHAPDPRYLKMLGFGLQRASGIAAGAVIEMQPARSALAAAVSQAEHAAGIRVDRILVGLNAGEPRSRTFYGSVELARGVVGSADVTRLSSGAYAYAAGGGTRLVSLNRVGFDLDGAAGSRDPLGLAGGRLGASHHAVVAAPAPIANLERLVASCQLDIEEIVPASYASALAVTSEEERRYGVVAIDIGAGVTTIAAFIEGALAYTAALPFGGQHITADIARELSLPLAEAERIKTLYASVASSASDAHELLMVEGANSTGHSPATVARGQVCRIAERRTSWMLAGMRACLDGSGSERIAGAAVVLTGGGSQLMGLEQRAELALERPVRLGAGPGLSGAAGRMPGSVPGPAFSCVTGLAMHAMGPSPWLEVGSTPYGSRGGYFGRVEQWLRESF